MPGMGSGDVGKLTRRIGLLPSGSGESRHQESLCPAKREPGPWSGPFPREQVRPEHGGS